MTEYGMYNVKDAKAIHAKVLGGDRTSSVGATGSQLLADKYYGVLTENLAAATNPLTSPATAQVRILRYDVVIDRTIRLATGDAALLTVVNRCKDVTYERGTLVVVERIMNEWFISGSDCDSQTELIAALDALE